MDALVGLLMTGRGEMVSNENERFILDTRKEFFMIRLVKYRNKLPRNSVDLSSLKTSKVRLDVALIYL